MPRNAERALAFGFELRPFALSLCRLLKHEIKETRRPIGAHAKAMGTVLTVCG
jgi:hypothetical protein